MRPVLVVEDDQDIREILQWALEGEGFDVLTAANGREALALLARTRPAVILLDLMMPILSGWDVLKHLRADAALAPIPVVVTTASSHLPAEGAQAVVHKPYDMEDVVQLVRELGARAGGEGCATSS